MKLKKCRRFLGLLIVLAGGSFCNVWSCSAATKVPLDRPQTALQEGAPPVDFTRLQFSAGLLDIVRMVKANVNPEVIRTFINHSPISYNPSAQEVIALKKLGVSNEIIVTLLDHRSRALESPRPSTRQMVRVPDLEDMPVLPRTPYGGGYPFQPYPAHAFPGFGSVSSFNNSFPTFVNGYPVYSGYYLQTYPVWW
jgi:hypothetical protein